jgi:hypothetical protein
LFGLVGEVDTHEQDIPWLVFQQVSVGFLGRWDIDEDIDLLSETEVDILVFFHIFTLKYFKMFFQ